MGRRKVTEEIVVESIVEEKIEEVKIEETPIEENIIDPVVEELVEKGQLYAVFDNGLLVAAVFESNPVLDSLLEYNKKQLEERLKFLHDIVTDENEICKMNINGSTKYSSWRQYRIQNGLTPIEPPIKTKIQYYQKQYHSLTEEEIAIRVYGNLRYGFNPIDML
jgi:ribosomal protein S13